MRIFSLQPEGMRHFLTVPTNSPEIITPVATQQGCLTHDTLSDHFKDFPSLPPRNQKPTTTPTHSGCIQL